ncbi:PREDICTED: F-box/kelch-repeat protein At5g43190 [Nelumbo nucifera]|uniref:F-box domain-containing protein n=2 Tax=Nelumbo nucifera TaxID=4432 RepID=A0A822ZAB0_NELNU|nr:PREDICTED: F-box/kelch-repeat protein At5g43190 [Nelumbo nucifera]DAD41503.1 TPA_asm: hypothetical protein HUJ06_015826 [Nelumbo nucifera]
MMVNCSSRTPMTHPEMEPAIWSRLPEELLERILAFLPFRTFLNLRSTCKRFNSLLFSPSFISLHSSSLAVGHRTQTHPPFSSFLLLSHPQFYHQVILYNSFQGHWRSLTLPSSHATSHLLSTSNGLLCFSLPNSSAFLVRNLLSRSSRLIEFPTYPFSFNSVSLISLPSKGYKILVLSTGSSSNSTFVYDSNSNSWSRFEGFDQILSENSHQEGVFCNGHLYFTTPEPFSIVGFELETGKWARPTEAELPEELTFVRLVKSGEGKLYMIGGIGSYGISKRVKLWELVEGRDWVEVERLPEMMCRKFTSVCYHNYEHVYCFWHDGMVCICCYTWPEILYYKVSRRTWHWLPRSPYLPEKWSCGFRWFSFVPDIYTLV